MIKKILLILVIAGLLIASTIFIPLVFNENFNLVTPVLNIPHFDGDTINYYEAAVTWFGVVRNNSNYADIRVGYNDTEIFVCATVFDSRLWYDETPNIHDLIKWDSVTLYIDTENNTGNSPRSTMYSFTRQLQWWEDGLNRQIAYQGNNSGWVETPITFYTEYIWRGDAPNDNIEDRGYVIIFHIPFNSLGLTVPSDGSKWGIGVSMYDRDDFAGIIFSNIKFPKILDPSRSVTWNQLSFGLPNYSLPIISNPQTFILREGLNKVRVVDGVTGGNTNCGDPVAFDFFGLWGDYNYYNTNEKIYANIQNQNDVADFPCFSKLYITFPLDSLPPNQEVISATLTLSQFGQSDGPPENPPEALIQIMVIDQDWDETTLNWNNGPAPIENVSQAWVGDVDDSNNEVKLRGWDLSYATFEAYKQGKPLRLVIYTSDIFMGHGKYFYTSDAYYTFRPFLTVTLGNKGK